MSGTTPNRAFPYPTSSDLVTDGAQAIQNLADAIDAELGPPARFAAYLAADQAIPNAAWTTLPFTETLDPAAALSAGVYTAPVAGLYLFTANVFWQSSTAGARYTSLWRATDVSIFNEIPGVAQMAPSGLDPRQDVSTVIHLNAGDRVKVQCFQSTGGNLNIIGGTDYGVDNTGRFGGTILVAD